MIEQRDDTIAHSRTLQRVPLERWHSVLDEFDDASIFQTPAFVGVKSPSARLEAVAVVSHDGPVAAALVRLFPARLPGTSVAYVLHGPLWRSRNRPPDPGVFRSVIRLLRDEYVVRRGVTLRIKPPPIRHGAGRRCEGLFEAEGYRPVRASGSHRTILIGVDGELPQIRKGLEQKWRNRLNYAERSGLTIAQGSDDGMFARFLPMYREMLSRKRLAEPGDLKSFMAMQELLPEPHRLTVLVAEDGHHPCAGAVVSAMGDRGIYLFGATGEAGLKNQASYLVQWRAIEWLKARGCVEYDLHGINPSTNPGVYTFKTGLCGRNGEEVEMPPAFDAYAGLRGSLAVRAADLLKEHSMRLRSTCARYLPSH